MKAVVVRRLCVLALGLAAPLAADTAYVPIVAPDHAHGSTQISISNYGAEEQAFSTRFIATEAAGMGHASKALAATVPADRALVLDEVAAAGETGLLAIESAPGLLIDAWLGSTSRDGRTFHTAVPVITAKNAVPAGGLATLAGLERGAASLGLVNLGERAASCTVEAFAADGSATGDLATVEVAARSLSRIGAAAGARAEVTCDEDFFAYALIVDGETSAVSIAAPTDPLAATAAAALPARAGKAGKQSIVYEALGLLHSATRANEKREMTIPVARQLALSKMVIDFDVIPGDWHPKSPSGNHALIWVHRGRYRSNSIANVNAFGPGKDFVKMNQNVDMPKATVTNAKGGKLRLQEDKPYHVRYTYDALTNKVTAVVSSEGKVLDTLVMKGTAKGKTLTVPKTGLVTEFGHWSGQHGPEVPTWGWRYLNLRIEMFPK